MQYLREARPPRQKRPSNLPFYVGALAIGTGIGAIVFFEWYLVGAFLYLFGIFFGLPRR